MRGTAGSFGSDAEEEVPSVEGAEEEEAVGKCRVSSKGAGAEELVEAEYPFWNWAAGRPNNLTRFTPPSDIERRKLESSVAAPVMSAKSSFCTHRGRCQVVRESKLGLVCRADRNVDDEVRVWLHRGFESILRRRTKDT